jgi:hypothetical protein
VWVIYGIFCTVGWVWAAIAIGFVVWRVVLRGRAMVDSCDASVGAEQTGPTEKTPAGKT